MLLIHLRWNVSVCPTDPGGKQFDLDLLQIVSFSPFLKSRLGKVPLTTPDLKPIRRQVNPGPSRPHALKTLRR